MMSQASALKTLFFVLGCLMVATLVYTISVDGTPFRKELLTPWMAATLVDFYINIIAIGNIPALPSQELFCIYLLSALGKRAWVFYKEENWIVLLLWEVLLVCFGSITACAYIVLQFFKLSAEETSQDPIYYVLVRRDIKDGTPQKKMFSVVTARVIFAVLGCVMLGTLLYTLLTDGSPFRSELLTPWMTATLIDFYVNVVAISVWVAYKETKWIYAICWIILLICFGSITTCAYIVLQLFYLPSTDPVHLILVNISNRSKYHPLHQ